MALTTSYFAADLAAMIADIPTVAKFGATEFDCAVTPLDTSETLLLTGNNSNISVRAVFPVSAFTATTAFRAQGHLSLKYPVATSFTSYEIQSHQLSPDLISWEVVLQSDNRA